MRSLAALAFLWAAFDWPAPWTDRVGLAALGLALLTLSLPRPLGRFEWASRFRLPPAHVELPDPFADDDEHEETLVDRLRAYGGAGA